MSKLIVNSSPHTIIDAYRNASMASEYHVSIYSVRNEAELDNSSPISKAAYLQVLKGDNYDNC